MDYIIFTFNYRLIGKYTPKQISSILELNNASWTANILYGLNGRGEIGNAEATDSNINTGGRKT